MPSSEVTNYFDSVAKHYREKTANGLWKILRQKERTVVSNFVGKGPFINGLELGCGAGFYTQLLNEKGFKKLVCVDISEAMMVQFAYDNCEKVVGDIEQFQRNERFDIVLCAGALEFVAHPEKVFNNVSAMLAEGGIFCLLVPKTNIFGVFYRLFHFLHGIRVSLFSERRIRALANTANLKIMRSQNVGLFSSVFTLTRLGI